MNASNEKSDNDVSPMEAQNAGQGRKGAAGDGPLPQSHAERPNSGSAEGEPVAKGGDPASRDDL